MVTKTETATDEEIGAQVKALRADLEKLSELVVRSGSERGSRLVRDARVAGANVLDEAMLALESGREIGERQVEGAEDWIRRNPFVAVLCALGAGFVLALFRSRP